MTLIHFPDLVVQFNSVIGIWVPWVLTTLPNQGGHSNLFHQKPQVIEFCINGDYNAIRIRKLNKYWFFLYQILRDIA